MKTERHVLVEALYVCLPLPRQTAQFFRAHPEGAIDLINGLLKELADDDRREAHATSLGDVKENERVARVHMGSLSEAADDFPNSADE